MTISRKQPNHEETTKNFKKTMKKERTTRKNEDKRIDATRLGWL